MILRQALMMAGGSPDPEYVGVTTAQQYSSTTSLGISIPAAAKAKDLLCLIVCTNGAIADTPAGWVREWFSGSTSPRITFFTRTMQSGDTAVTLTATSSRWAIQMMAFRHAAYEGDSGAVTRTGAGTLTAASFSLASRGFIMSIFAIQGSGTLSATVPSGMTLGANIATSTAALLLSTSYVLLPTAGASGTKTSTLSMSSGDGIGLLYGIKRA